jgi:hypothetical protein
MSKGKMMDDAEFRRRYDAVRREDGPGCFGIIALFVLFWIIIIPISWWVVAPFWAAGVCDLAPSWAGEKKCQQAFRVRDAHSLAVPRDEQQRELK